MTDDRTLTALDERGRAAAAGVRTAVADRPVPAFDPDLVRISIDSRSDRPRRSRPVIALAVAAAVLVVAAAAAVLVVGGADDDDSTPAERTRPAVDGRYRLGEAPDGWVVAGISDDPASDVDAYGRATLYGPDDTHPRLAVAALPDDVSFGCSTDDGDDGCTDRAGDDVPDVAAGLDVVAIDGSRAWDASTRFGGPALLVEVGDDVVLVAGSSLSASERVSVAEGIVAGDRPTVAPEAIPRGFAELATAPLLAVLGPGSGIVGTGGPADARWWIWYGGADPADDRRGSISVSVAAGSALDVGIGGVLATEHEDVTVRGADGQITRLDVPSTDGTVWSVRWEETPGEVVDVVVAVTADRPFTRDQVLALAEGVVPLDDGDLRTLRRAIADRGLDQPGVTVVGEGTFTDGETWRLVHGLGDADLALGGLSLRTEATPSGSSTFSSGGGVAGPDGQSADDGPVGGEAGLVDGSVYAWAFGPVTDPAVTAVEVWRDGAAIATATVVRSGGQAGWVAELPSGLPGEGASDELVVVAFDADGAELGRLSL